MNDTTQINPPLAGGESEENATQKRLFFIFLAILVTAVAAIVMYRIQFATKSLVATDGYFHIKYSYLMAHGEGIMKRLPWLRYTIHNDSYRDHHFLFHVLYIPFTFGDLRLGAKIGAWLFATLAMAGFYLVAARRDKTAAVIGTGLLLGCSTRFLTRMSMTRVPSLSMLFMLLAIHALITRRRKCLAVIMFAFVWLYDGFALMLPVLVFFILADAIVEKRFDGKLLAWCLGGIVAGIVVNPYFPANISSYWFNLWRASGEAQVAYDTGWEWKPVESWKLFTSAKIVWGALAVGVFFAVLQKRPTRETVALLLTALLATVLVFKARRYLDTWPPLAMLFLVYAWSDFWQQNAEDAPRHALRRRIIASVALALLLLSAPGMIRKQIEKTSNEKVFEYYKGAAEYIREATRDELRPPLVFNTDWDDFPYLFFFNSDCHYILGLDKLYMVRYDEALYNLWREVGSGAKLEPSKVIADEFHADYVVVDKGQTSGKAFMFMADEKLDRGLKLVYEDSFCAVYRVTRR